MKLMPLIALALVSTTPVFAEQTRQLDAHEHGVGQLDIAFDGKQILMELHAPGADIVGFEYAAESAEDRAKVDAAVAMLARPLDLFVITEAAGCTLVQASAELERDEGQVDHEDEHDDHEDANHQEKNTDEPGHTEFHAEYLLACANPGAVTKITFTYFDAFPNALEVEVQLISNKGATSFEVERDAPTLDLRGMF
jgi:hypothetical protein|tara:strand:- start:978 stop:1565 length:588 start_codon:yes stop_codon:yes gene_type:complete